MIANTQHACTSARRPSTGLTLAEYYRDMGYDVAIMADSTSRWAEAPVSCPAVWRDARRGRLPGLLASRLSAFYERAGMCRT
ncbi:MAG: hypothetical protein ACLUOI_33500 [Eisenbergiella sp.]